MAVLGLLVSAVATNATVVVEELPAGSTLANAGIQVDDRLMAWERPDGLSGVFDSPFTWRWLQLEQAPRGPIRLTGARRGEPLEVIVAPGEWGAEVRPELPANLLEAYRSGRSLLAAGDLAEAAATWQRSASSTERLPVRCWLLLRAGEVLRENGEPEAAEAVLKTALEFATTPQARIAVLIPLALTQRYETEFQASEESLRSALAIWQSEGPGGLGETYIWNHLAETAEAQGDLETTDRWLSQAAARLDHLAPHSVARARIWAAQGRLDFVRGRYDEAEKAHRQAADLLEQLAPGTRKMAIGWMNLALVPYARGDLKAAEDYTRRAWALLERLEPRSLNAGACLENLGSIAFQQGDLKAAEGYLLSALEIREHLSPASIAVVKSLTELGVVVISRGDLKQAQNYYQRALAILKSFAPNSLNAASNLSNLGNLATEYGDLAEAKTRYMEALELQQRLSPEGVDTAVTLMKLGSISQQRGNFVEAESWYRRALEIQNRSAPAGENMATLQARLGSLLMERGELPAAEGHLLRALTLRQQRAPESLSVAEIWNILGRLAQRQGQLDVAADRQSRALRIQEAVVPESLPLTRSLVHLGRLEFERGDLSRSRQHLRRALAILEPLVPNSHVMAAALQALGEVDLAEGLLESAKQRLSQALGLLDRQSQMSYRQVECLDSLARIASRQGQPTLAWQRLERAIRILEAQIGKLGGDRELHGSFRARFGHVYRLAIDVLLELGRPTDAFEMLESRRARSLLAMLAERDLVFADVPAELETARRHLAARYDRTFRQLTEPSVNFEQAADLRQTLEQLHSERRALNTRIRESSPRLAELKDPQPSSLAQIRAALDPETVLLSYSIGDRVTRLFAVSRADGLRVFDLDAGEDDLRQRISGLRTLIEQRRNPGSPTFRPLIAAAAALYDQLLRPAGDLIAGSERLLVVPDGPLFQLPFGALVDATAGGDGQYLIERKPIHTVVSGTIYARLRQLRDIPSHDSARQLVAFGDPVYPSGLNDSESGLQEPQVRSAARFFDLRPLPGSRQEAERIAGLYPRGVELLLGEQATEERAKSLERNIRYVHFAAHGLLNERFPLDSAVALSLRDSAADGQENGLLQVWEIFERVRVNADLVVLSACQTAGGEYVDGEGLIGLTRAFHYAGARSVVASLWSVDDQATSELMFHFYRGLSEGLDKDEALRLAQLNLLRRSSEETNLKARTKTSASAPYFWAAFQLYGDRR